MRGTWSKLPYRNKKDQLIELIIRINEVPETIFFNWNLHQFTLMRCIFIYGILHSKKKQFCSSKGKRYRTRCNNCNSHYFHHHFFQFQHHPVPRTGYCSVFLFSGYISKIRFLPILHATVNWNFLPTLLPLKQERKTCVSSS